MENLIKFEEFNWGKKKSNIYQQENEPEQWVKFDVNSILGDIKHGMGFAHKIDLVGKLKGSGARVYRYTTSTGDKVKVYPTHILIGEEKIKNTEIYKLIDGEYMKSKNPPTHPF